MAKIDSLLRSVTVRDIRPYFATSPKVFLAADRARKRGALLEATERDLAQIAAATQRAMRPLRGQARIALRVGKVLGRRRVGKHFTLELTDRSFRAVRDEVAIAQEAALDGIYILRTNLAAARLPTEEVVRRYKRLATIERAFRNSRGGSHRKNRTRPYRIRTPVKKSGRLRPLMLTTRTR